MPRKLDLPGITTPIKKIVPLRAPRMSQSYDHLPPATKELVDMMDRLKGALLENANDGVIELDIGDVRAALSVVRSVRNLNASRISARSSTTHAKLEEKYLNRPVKAPKNRRESPNTGLRAWLEEERRRLRRPRG